MEINKSHNQVTTTANNGNDTWEEIFRVDVPDKQVYTLNDNSVLIMDLRDSSDDKLPADTEVFLGMKTPDPILPDDIAELSYQPYFQLSLADQLNENNQGALRIDIGERVDFIEKTEIHIWISSDTAIDWSNSQLVLNVKAQQYR